MTALLLAGALAELERLGVAPADRTVAWVPGAFELPLAAMAMARTLRYDAVVCLGAVIRGETSHYDFVAGECASGLQRVQLDLALPVIFGVLTTENLEQALERAGGALGNKGAEAVATAIEMATVLRQLSGTAGPASGAAQSPSIGPCRKRHLARCSVSPCPKARSSRRRSSFSAPPTSAVRRASDVDYRATIDDPRVDDVHILRPQEIPTYVAEGLFDLGVTGRDWIEETGAEVVSLGELHYSKATTNPIRIVLAVGADSPVQKVEELERGCRVSTEYPRLTKRFLAERGVEADVRFSYGATEAKVPDIADAVVEITETGRALRAAGLRVIDTLLRSYTELVANPIAAADPEKSRAMGQLLVLLQGALEAARQGAGQVECRTHRSSQHHRRAAVDAVADGGEAVRRGGLRRRGGRSQVGDQRAHPGPQRAGGDRHHRAPDRQDRPLTGSSPARAGDDRPGGGNRAAGDEVLAWSCRGARLGTVETFDAERGLGTVEDAGGAVFGFHSTAIADGSRLIATGRKVAFVVGPAHGGRLEASWLTPVDGS